MDLKRVKTEDLLKELRMREKVKSSIVTKDESVKIVVSGPGSTRERYIRFTGPGVVIQIEKLKL